jgi:hypothetical protein
MRGTVQTVDRRPRPYVENLMKTHSEMTVWSIIERLQRRLERQGWTAAATDRAVALALRELARHG